MKFFQKEICEKLVKLGCVSLSNHEWWGKKFATQTSYTVWSLTDASDYQTSNSFYVVQAFTLLDFLSTEEYARENCRILFGDRKANDMEFSWCTGCQESCCGMGLDWHVRHAILDSPDGIDYVVKFIQGMK